MKSGGRSDGFSAFRISLVRLNPGGRPLQCRKKGDELKKWANMLFHLFDLIADIRLILLLISENPSLNDAVFL